MKRMENDFGKRTILALLTLAIISSSLYADMPDELKCRDKKSAITNLIQGIKSNNIGLMKCSVYFAGKYRVEATVPALIEKLNSINDSNCKVLIALSLYLIGDESGIEAIYRIARTDRDSHVRHMCNAIYAEYVQSKTNGKLIAGTDLF